VIGLAGAILLAQLGLTVANIGLPSMMTALAVPFGAVQWVVLSYLITMTALAVYAGRLGDRFGKQRLLLVGLGIFGLASLLCAITPNLPLLVAGRALQGAGAALLNSRSRSRSSSTWCRPEKPAAV
jgi:MFS family permease